MRKHLALTAMLCLSVSTPALAQTTTATGTGTAVSGSQSASGAIAAGNVTNINSPANTTATVHSNVSGTTTSNVNSRVSGTQTVRSNPSIATGLAAAGLETCLGSASAGLSLAGLGLTGGSTYVDPGCEARLDSRTLASYGLKRAAVARLCQQAKVWNSMPDVCQENWPVGMPVPVGVIVIEPTARITMSANGGAGIIRVIDGRDGVEKDCLNYNAGAQRCTHWLGEAPRKPRQRVANVQAPHRIVVKPKPEAKPKVEPVVEPAKVEPKVEPEKKS